MSDRKWVATYVKNKEKIARHAFLPFVHKQILARKFRKEYDECGKVMHEGKRILSSKPKTRDIFYANHLDSQIFSYYSNIISKKYEKLLNSRNLENNISAYRRIPKNKDIKNTRNRCNIDFANEVFEHIRAQYPRPLVAITFDIKSFFDNLDHHILKQKWALSVGKSRLPNDHFNVFKNITKFAYVRQIDLFNLFKDQIWVQSKSGKKRKKEIVKNKYLKDQKAIAYCTKKEFIELKKKTKGLIKSYKFRDESQKVRRISGIPQGSPISAVLANVYLIDFDTNIKNLIEKDGFYRRYSDDMIIVCDKERKNEIIERLTSEIERYKLQVQSAKTQVFHFSPSTNAGKYKCLYETKTKQLISTRRLEYLGFEFDGDKVFLKSSTLAKYYRKMKRTVRRHVFFAEHTRNISSKGEVFRKRIFLNFSYKGAHRRKIYRMNKNTNEWNKTKKYDWGNFITYAKLASNNIKNNKIKQQIRNHWRILNELINQGM